MQIATQRPLLSLEQIASEAVFVAMMRLTNKVTAEVDFLFKEYGLTPAQYNTLRVLRDAGPQGLSCQQISDALIQRDPDITRLADRLEERGLVTKNRAAHDRRIVMVQPTPEGLKLVADLDWPSIHLLEEQMGALDLKEKQQLLALINKLLLSRQNDNLCCSN
jgi:DNA-binding MarR family transcriptional regulator